MYCPKCGKENPDNAQLCQFCNWVMSSVSQPPAADAKTSGLAIAALVLGILSFFTLFLTAIPAIICGIIGLVKISNSAGRLKGTGLAIAGIAAPVVLIPFICCIGLLMGILMPALARVRQTAYQMVCGTNLSGLSKAMLLYTSEYDDKYPTAEKWCDLLPEKATVPRKSFRCKGASEGPCNYAMNKNVENLGRNAPADMVLLFESKPGWNQSGGPEILTTNNHHDGCNVLFVDGHVEFVKTGDINKLRWTAEPNP